MKYYNLENHTDEVTLDQLFQMREHLFGAVERMQDEMNDDTDQNPYGGVGACIEGDGFNLTFCVGGKEFMLRCALR